MKEILKSKVQILNTTLNDYLTSGPKSIQEFKIDCTKLDAKFLKEDIRCSVEFKDIFQQLEKNQNNPCLYIFEIESEISTDIILHKLKNFGKKTDKVIPKIKNNILKSSKTLYVGKVNSFIWGRLITHLGFHTHKNNGSPQPSTNHGLQLHFWAKELLLQLKYTVIEFEPNMKDILPVLEKQLAFELNPIIGQHK